MSLNTTMPITSITIKTTTTTTPIIKTSKISIKQPNRKENKVLDQMVSNDAFSLTRSEYNICQRNQKNHNVLGELTFNVFVRSKFKDICEEPCYRVCELIDCVRLKCKSVNY